MTRNDAEARQDGGPSAGLTPGGLRIGHGYDLHRLEEPPPRGQGRPLVLGGVRLEHDRGPVGHSDGDALLHALTDALLGALGLPDIGRLFPDTAPENEGRDSRDFLNEAVRRVREAGWGVVNVDCTVILERPKLGAHREAMRANIAEMLGIGVEDVNVKGKTHEKVDAVGEGRAVEVHVVALLMRATSAGAGS
ncbi:MAG: 2-C-methyl-D-erythritol 2,4-cyclodiphosphate synthase [Phycisphaeraceae bacterium]|nr:MAG: 2-C-methyl-D-erythritol 2,4-cyclodiphosphate synthase [Phycisphaeraceae bacterium]